MKKVVAGLLFFMCSEFLYAQIPGILKRNGSAPGATGNTRNTTTSKADSLGIPFEHRDDAKDSISISFKYLDSARNNTLDSSINDFYKYFSVPAEQQYLGNNGAAGYSLIYTPYMKAGWDAGFHAFDVYRLMLEDTRFFKTSKPFSQLSYQLASGKEQMVKVLHTQNPRPNLNFGFEYKLISAPGFFKTQNTNHNNYRIFGNYQGKRKRYAAYIALLGNTLKASENGGIQNDSSLSDKTYKIRYSVPVNLGREPDVAPNPFKSNITTGNVYKDFTFFLRQSYDVGKKDSVAINDSTTEYLFYSKLRFQYSLTYTTYSYHFTDANIDSAIYQKWYNISLPDGARFDAQDKWKIIANDLSLLQFPDTKNAAQFFMAGTRLENIKGIFGFGERDYHNVILHGEYRNKTRNKLWDIFGRGEFYLEGLNSGDYSAYGTLARVFGKRWGAVRLTFNNVNRSPSFIYSDISSFNNIPAIYKKENITLIKAAADNNFISLYFANYFISNLLYFSDYYHTAQSGKIISVLQLGASKKIRLGKKLNWYADVVVQQTDGSAPVKVPLVFTRNRFAFEGVFYKNLNLSTGIEFRYYTPYNAYNYSPVMGQFFPQDTVRLKNIPDISTFLHFRIKTFTAYLRAENLNAVDFSDGLTFTNNNFAAPHYVYPGFIFRVGVQWRFVN